MLQINIQPDNNDPLFFSIVHSLLIILIGSFMSIAHAETKVALIIGNANYQSSPLTNPKNDAVDMSAMLKSLGFEVDLHMDLDRSNMRKAIRAFGEKLKRADTGLFYYAGHGIQINGRNYLVPLNFDVSSADEVQDESIDASAVLRKMEAAGNNTNIIILDACRNNPFARSFRSLEHGLARMDGPVGSFIAYATSPGSVAADGSGRNGVYTHHLLEALKKPGLSIEQTFKWVRNAVRQETDGEQTPWESSSLMGEFVFRANNQNTPDPAITPTMPVISNKYLQVLTNVANAHVSINNIDRGITDKNGVLNIKHLREDQIKVLVYAEGYNPEVKTINLVANQWEQINIVMIPKPDEVFTNQADAGTDTISCIKNKRALIASIVQYSPDNEEKQQIKRNSPELMTLLRTALQPYGLKFVDAELFNHQLHDEEKYQEALSQATRRSKAHYLIKLSSSIQETPIQTIRTNMKTIEGDLTLQWVDLTNHLIMGSTTNSFRQAGLNRHSVLRTAAQKNLNMLAKKIIEQVCQ